MYNIFVSAMNETYDLTKMLERINRHHILGNLTDDEREKLVTLAQNKATPFGGVDVMAKLNDLDARVRALEEAGKTAGGESTEETVPDYQVGKWYYNGDKVTFDSKVYTCIAPAGVVCVWSPAEYPAYWELV